MTDFLADDDVEEMLPRPRLESSVIVDDGRYAGGADFNRIRARLLDLREAARSGGVPLADGSTTRRPLSARLAEERNPLDFGAVADGVTDCAAAFEAIFASFGRPEAPAGGRIKIPPGVYRMSRPLRVTRQVVIDGAGGAGWFGATVLKFDAGVHGIIVDRPITSPDGGRGDWSTIRDISVHAAGKSGVAHGVTLYTRASLIRLNVSGFSGNGINIDSGHAGDPLITNSNCWRIDGGRIEANTGHGVLVRGQDSNAGMAVGVDCSGNGGIGFYDNSFLGNTYVGCHTDINEGGAYKADSPAGFNVFLGCYSEGGQPTSEISHPSLVLGGDHGAGLSGSGVFITAPYAQMPLARVDVGAGTYPMGIGNSDKGVTNSFLAFNVGGTHTFLWKYWPIHSAPGLHARNIFAFNWSNAGGYCHYALAGEGAALDVSAASATEATWVAVERTVPLFSRQQGHYSGGSHVVHRDAIPDAGTWNVGDIIYSRAPTPGGSIGWVCTTAGTLGTYSEGLTATATGTKTITLSAATTVLAVGMVVTVGATKSRVQAVDGVTVTMLDNIPAGSGLAIAFSAPVLKTFGSISA